MVNFKSKFLLAPIFFLCLLMSCDNEDDVVDNCLSNAPSQENTFVFNSNSYDVSDNSTTNFVVCAGGEIDAFFSANNANEITFGFKPVSQSVDFSLDADGLPSPRLVLSRKVNFTETNYAATSGTLSPCEGGYTLSVTLQQIQTPDNLELVQGGNTETLTAYIKCP